MGSLFRTITHYLLMGSLLLGLLSCGSDPPSTLTTPGIPDSTQVWFEGDPTTFDSTDAAIAFGIAVLKEPPNSVANPANDQIRAEVESRFGISLNEQQLNSSNGFVLAAADLDGNGQVNSQDAAVAFAVAVLREPPNNLPCPSKVQVQTEVERRFGLSVALLNPIPCSGSSFPSGIPSPDVTPSAEASEPPTGTIQIIGVEDKDGIPLTIGETLRLEAVAIDGEGRDISQRIEWRNAQNQVVGRGAVLDYPANSVVMETLTAQIGENQSKAQTGMASARVSFTVSTPEAVIAPHVKVLPEQAEELIESTDWEQNLLTLKLDKILPTIYRGDVIVGANASIPPMRVLAYQIINQTLQLQLEPALPNDVIIKGSTQFQETAVNPQVVNKSELSTCSQLFSGGETYPIETLAGNQAITIPFQWEDFVGEVNSNFSLAASWGYSYQICPDFRLPELRFSTNEFGVDYFRIGIGYQDLVIDSYLQMNGLGEVDQLLNSPDIPFFFTTIAGTVGPVAVWVNLRFSVKVEEFAGMEAIASGRLGWRYSGASLNPEAVYENGEWKFSANYSQGSFSPLKEGQLDLSGVFEAGINLGVNPTVWGIVAVPTTPPVVVPVPPISFPRIGGKVYGRAETIFSPNANVQISQPEEEVVYPSFVEIPIAASFQDSNAVEFFVGMRATLGNQASLGCLTTDLSTRSSSCPTPQTTLPNVGFSEVKYPESAKHVKERRSTPDILTIDRKNSTSRRVKTLRNAKKPPLNIQQCPSGQQRDEYPPAVFLENNGNAHVKCIKGSDNMGSGSNFSKYMPESTHPDGTQVRFVIYDAFGNPT